LACGQALRLGEVQTAHAAFGDAKGAPVIHSDKSHQTTLDAYLAEYDASCPSCTYNLRGLTGSTCPECGHTLYLCDLLPEEPGPEVEFLPLYPWFATIAIPAIVIGIVPLLVEACRAAWDLILLNPSSDIPVGLLFACVAAVGVVYAIRRSRVAKTKARAKTRAALERAQNIRIAIVLILFAVSIIQICRMSLYAMSRIFYPGW